MDDAFVWWWVGAGVVGSFIFIAMNPSSEDSTFDEDTAFGGPNGCFIIIGGLLGFVTLAGVLIFAVVMAFAKAEESKLEAERVQKNKENAAKRRLAAKNKKEKVLKDHQSQIETLLAKKTDIENEPDNFDSKFFKDCAKLAKDLTLLAKKDVKNKEEAVNILRFARVNIFNHYPEGEMTEAEKLADSLTEGLKKLG
tara:strand:+ start:746 stop:1333 length:588 start_codon:yes stop_codon:yes gene_type:complete